MAEILVAALSPIGHIGPLLNVARGLVDRGDRVTFLSGAGRADDIRARVPSRDVARPGRPRPGPAGIR